MFHKSQIITSTLTWLKAQGKRILGSSKRSNLTSGHGTTHDFGPQVAIRIIRAKRYEEKVKRQKTGKG